MRLRRTWSRSSRWTRVGALLRPGVGGLVVRRRPLAVDEVRDPLGRVLDALVGLGLGDATGLHGGGQALLGICDEGVDHGLRVGTRRSRDLGDGRPVGELVEEVRSRDPDRVGDQVEGVGPEPATADAVADLDLDAGTAGVDLDPAAREARSVVAAHHVGKLHVGTTLRAWPALEDLRPPSDEHVGRSRLRGLDHRVELLGGDRAVVDERLEHVAQPVARLGAVGGRRLVGAVGGRRLVGTVGGRLGGRRRRLPEGVGERTGRIGQRRAEQEQSRCAAAEQAGGHQPTLRCPS